MSEPSDLLLIKGSKKARCPYCAGEKHLTELACPRIIHIDVDPDTGKTIGIDFGDFPTEPSPAAA